MIKIGSNTIVNTLLHNAVTNKSLTEIQNTVTMIESSCDVVNCCFGDMFSEDVMVVPMDRNSPTATFN